MTLVKLLEKILNDPRHISFDEVINTISENYSYTPVDFFNGHVQNKAGTNEGSCKIFAFAQINCLSKEQTLACFGQYYRDDVLAHPEGKDHANIRNFMKLGWEGITFSDNALVKN